MRRPWNRMVTNLLPPGGGRQSGELPRAAPDASHPDLGDRARAGSSDRGPRHRRRGRRPGRRLQRQRASLRPPARRGGVRRDPQLDVGRRPARLAASRQQEKGIPVTARCRHPRPPDRHVLRVPDARAESRTSADKIADRARPVGIGRTSYLCHTVCAFGATRATDALRDVRDFLAAHPREVLLISIEDHIRPRDIARVVRAERAGALRLARPPRPAAGSRPCAR